MSKSHHSKIVENYITYKLEALKILNSSLVEPFKSKQFQTHFQTSKYFMIFLVIFKKKVLGFNLAKFKFFPFTFLKDAESGS